ncbi:MAG: hypothetical protein VB996_09710 [Pseudomonadales bacterium]|jgi:hypothetical protein
MRKIPKAALLLTLIIFAGFANAEVDPELLERMAVAKVDGGDCASM